MTNVRETITAALTSNGLSGYTRQAEPVITAVEARENGIVESLVTFARSKGLSEVEARGALQNAGLPGNPVVAQAPVTATGGGSVMESILTTLKEIADKIR